MKHANIIKVYDIEQRFKTVFLIMEYLSGETLSTRLKHQKVIPPPVAVHFLSQICSGLQYAHHRGIIHRDINASNIMIQPHETLKILDFGLACPIGTQDFSSLGTLAYMAPEQITGDPLDPRTDIYAVGILAYEMLVGERPYAADEPRKLERMHLTQDIPDPLTRVPDLPKNLQGLILKCCRRDPHLRYGDINQLMADLKTTANAPVVASDNQP